MTTLRTSGADLLVVGQNLPESTVNLMGRHLDALIWGAVVESRVVTAPPATVGDGVNYLVPSGATGAWASFTNYVATSVGTNASNGWIFADVLKEGVHLYIKDEDIEIVYTGSAWAAYGTSGRTLIVNQTADGTVGTYTFSGISGSYTDLLIEIMARGDTAAAGVNCFLRFNSDTAANYDNETHRADNATSSATPSAAQTSIFIGDIPAGTARANEAGRIIIDVHYYAGTTFNKNAMVRSGRKTSDAAAGLRSDTIYGAWRSTAAVTAVSLLLTAGNFVSGSRIRIYGIT